MIHISLENNLKFWMEILSDGLYIWTEKIGFKLVKDKSLQSTLCRENIFLLNFLDFVYWIFRMSSKGILWLKVFFENQ